MRNIERPPLTWKVVRTYWPYFVVSVAMVVLICAGFATGETSTGIVGLLVSLPLALVIWQRLRSLETHAGRSLGGGVLFTRVPLRPDEAVELELGECGVTPKRYGRLYLTNQRLIYLPGRTHMPLANTKPITMDISDIVDVQLVRSHWLLRTLGLLRSRVRVVLSSREHVFWPIYGTDAEEHRSRYSPSPRARRMGSLIARQRVIRCNR